MLARLNERIKRSGAYRRYRHSVPFVTIREWDKRLQRKLRLSKYRGTEFCCPVCGVELRAFKPVTNSYMKMTHEAGYAYPLAAVETFNVSAYYCPSCDASDRERLYALYLDRVFRSLDRSRRYRMVEFAPSPGLQRKLKSYPFLVYRSADLYRRTVDDRVDITDMHRYADGSVDIFLCSHVLEHVPDDRRAMRELNRILRRDGFGIVMVPLVQGVEETHEDPAIDTSMLRWKYYGADDHLRQYGGRDFADRLAAAGFTVERLGVEHFGAEAFRRAGIAANSVLYVVRRADASAAGGEADTKASRSTARLKLTEQPRVLVIAMRRLGDVLLTTPLVCTLRQGLQARVDMLVFRGTEGMLAGNPDVATVLTLSQRPSVGELLALIRRLWRRYDLAVSTQSGDRPTLLAFAAGRRRIGFVEAKGGGGWWKRRALDIAVAVDPDNHRVVELLRLAEGLGIADRTELVCPANVSAPSIAALAPEVPGGPYAVLHANPMYRFRRWTDEGWRELARALAGRGLTVVVTGGPDAAERSYLDTLWGPADPPVHRLDGRLDWPQLSALIGGAAVFVGPDTSMTHLAAGTGCPTVALYGPASPHRIGPWPLGGLDEPWAPAGRIQRRANVWVVQNPLPCLPCEKLGCEGHYQSYSQCLDELSVRQVLSAVDQALASAGVPA